MPDTPTNRVAARSNHRVNRQCTTQFRPRQRIRQKTLIDAIVIGVTGSLVRPLELVLARPDEDGYLRRIGLSLPLAPRLRDLAGQYVQSTGESPERVSTGGFGLPSTEYLPVHPDLVAEVEAEASVETFTSRLRPRVHRLRPDLSVEDLELPMSSGDVPPLFED